VGPFFVTKLSTNRYKQTMGMNGSYYKAHIENMKLRKNKARYKRLKENAYERIYNVGLKFNQPSADDLKKIRKSIFEDMRMEKRKRRRLTWIGLAVGFVFAILVGYMFQYRMF
jgi:hypothetical protein